MSPRYHQAATEVRKTIFCPAGPRLEREEAAEQPLFQQLQIADPFVDNKQL